MESFGPDIEFTKTWRSYQGRVLNELSEHMGDNHLHVVAAPGSGKTVLGRHLATRLGLDVVNLDRLFYDDGWNPTPAEKYAAIQRELVAADRWLIEGNYVSSLHIRLARADTVIFLRDGRLIDSLQNPTAEMVFDRIRSLEA